MKNEPHEKRCMDCNRMLPIACFWQNKPSKDGHVSVCNECYERRYNNIERKNCPRCSKRKAKMDAKTGLCSACASFIKGKVDNYYA
jgi:hypothetical protein